MYLLVIHLPVMLLKDMQHEKLPGNFFLFPRRVHANDNDGMQRFISSVRLVCRPGLGHLKP